MKSSSNLETQKNHCDYIGLRRTETKSRKMSICHALVCHWSEKFHLIDCDLVENFTPVKSVNPKVMWNGTQEITCCLENL